MRWKKLSRAVSLNPLATPVKKVETRYVCEPAESHSHLNGSNAALWDLEILGVCVGVFFLTRKKI